MTGAAVYGVPSFNRYQQQWDDRNIPLPYSHVERQNFRACPVARPERMLSSRESESESSGTTTRRRIAVACARCRKRKIKCSGDPGNGMGCQNCRTAGADSCNFHRVNSVDCPLRTTQSLGNHPGGFSSTPNLAMVSVYQPPASYPVYSRSYPHGLPLSITTRNLPAVDWPQIAECDSPVDGYSLQPPAPITSSQPYSAMYAVPSGGAWTALNERPPSINNYIEKEQSTTTLPYLNPVASHTPSVSTEGPSPFNVGALQSSLPRAATVNRQLPVPTMAMRQIALPHSVEAPPLHLPAGSSSISRDHVVPVYHSAGNWAHEQYAADYRHSHSTSSAPAAQISTVPARISTATTSTTSTSPQSYAETSSSPEASPTTLTSLPEGATPSSATTPSVLNAASALSHIGNGYHNSTAPNHVIRRNESIHNLADYQYSADKPNPLGELSSGSDTLANGQRYEPIAQPQPERVANVKAVRRESWGTGTAILRQASLTRHARNY